MDLTSKITQHELVRAADPTLAFDATVCDSPAALADLLGSTVDTLVLRPEFSPRHGSAVLRRPGHPVPRAELDALWAAGDRVLAHRWVPGTPYFANGVVFDGEPVLTDCWRCFVLDEGVRSMLTAVVNVAGDAPVLAVLAGALRTALAALGVRNGPVHAEVVLTGTAPAGVKIVKIAPRLAGEPLRTMCRELGIVGQADAVSARGPAEVVQPDPASVGFIADYTFIARRSGRLSHVEGLDAIRARPSYHADLVMPVPGDHLERSAAGESVGASILLRGHDEPTVLADIAYYQRRNAAGVFVLAD